MITTDIKKQISLELEKYLLKHQISSAQFAAKTQVNEAYISRILNQNYTVGSTEIGDKYFKTIAAEIGLELTRNYWKVQPTLQLSAAISKLKESKEQGSTSIIIGATGSGKSFAAELFCKRNPAHTYMIKAGSSDNLSDLIYKIMDAARLNYAATKSRNINIVIKHFRELNRAGHQPTIIIDEAEYLKQATICVIKELYDQLIGYCGIVMCGTPELMDNIERMRRRNKPGIAQFYRRVKFNITYLPAIDKKFEQFLQEVEDKEVIAFLRRNCDNYGELHDALLPALKYAHEHDQPLTVDVIKRVLNIAPGAFV